ncbi:uracil-DNA glycosylase, partial [Methylobacterium variabile]
MPTDDSVAGALARFRAAGSPWLALPFFRDGSAERVAEAVDARREAGARVLPAPENIFNALTLTPLDSVRAVILGQDPYPTPGDAH